MSARVLILSWEYPPVIEGGLARHVRKLAEALVRQGVERGRADPRRGGGPPKSESYPAGGGVGDRPPRSRAELAPRPATASWHGWSG